MPVQNKSFVVTFLYYIVGWHLQFVLVAVVKVLTRYLILLSCCGFCTFTHISHTTVTDFDNFFVEIFFEKYLDGSSALAGTTCQNVASSKLSFKLIDFFWLIIINIISNMHLLTRLEPFAQLQTEKPLTIQPVTFIKI